MIEIDGIKLCMERKHRHALKRQLDKGVTRTWRATPGNVSATWYREDQTRPWGKAEVKRFRMEAKKKRERERVEAEEAARRAEVEPLRRCWGVKIDDDVVHGARYALSAHLVAAGVEGPRAYRWGAVVHDELRPRQSREGDVVVLLVVGREARQGRC